MENTFWGYGLTFYDGIKILSILSVITIALMIIITYDYGTMEPRETIIRNIQPDKPIITTASNTITFIKTEKDIITIPKWVKRLDPVDIDTRLMIDSFKSSITFSYNMEWDNWKPTIGETQNICGKNKDCWYDFGYR